MLPWGWVELNLLLPAFVLVLARVSGVMLTAPMFGSVLIPYPIKVVLILAISSLVFPVLSPLLPTDLTITAMLVGMLGELVIGLVIGLGLSAILLAMQMAGMIISQQCGIAMAAVIDPTTEAQTSDVGQVYFWVATVLFLMLGGHRVMLDVLLKSFATVPVMTFTAGPPVVQVMTDLVGLSMEFAVRVAGPAILALLVTKIGMGFVSRTMPQLHVLSVGFPIMVCVGMFFAAMGISHLDDLLYGYLEDAFDLIRSVLRIGT